MAELLALEPYPDDPSLELEVLRIMADAELPLPQKCPECGCDLRDRDVEAHAESHWPAKVPRRLMSAEALAREKALYKLAGKEPPEHPS